MKINYQSLSNQKKEVLLILSVLLCVAFAVISKNVINESLRYILVIVGSLVMTLQAIYMLVENFKKQVDDRIEERLKDIINNREANM